jgi:hypothetical protein
MPKGTFDTIVEERFTFVGELLQEHFTGKVLLSFIHYTT